MKKLIIAGVAIMAASPVLAQAVNVNGNLSFNPTTNGVVGTVTNDNASAGVVGEFLSVTVAGGSAVSLASGTAKNVTSLVLTPGDWDVRGYIAFNPAGTTTQSLVLSALNTTSGVIPQPTPAGASETVDYPVPAGIGEGYSVPTARISVATNTTVYLITNNTFSGGANAAYGYIAARRTR